MKTATCFILGFIIWSQPSLASYPDGPWYALYERALNAQENKDWRGSIQLLLQSIKEKPRPALKAKTYGLRFVNYVPYYYLGVAHYHLGEKTAALNQFDVSEKYGEIQQAPDEYAFLRRIRAELTGEKDVSLADDNPKGPSTPDLSSDNSPWYVSYETALAYVDAGDWLNSAENLKRTLAVKGIPKAYARTYGLWYISYLPYYYLGLS